MHVGLDAAKVAPGKERHPTPGESVTGESGPLNVQRARRR